MPVNNNDIAEVFNKIADLLEIKGDNPFRIRAYRDAARTIGGLSKDASDLTEEGKDLSELPGIGKDLAGKVKTIIQTGTHPLLEDLKQEIPEELSGLMKLQGMGPKKVAVLYKKLGVKTAEELRKAAEEQKIRDLEGFGETTEENIIDELERHKGEQKRFKLSVAEQRVKSFLKYMKEEKKIKSIEIAGSFRRRKETVGDIDILVTCKRGCQVMDRFIDYEDVEKVISKGETRSSVILKSGLQVDLRKVPQVAFGAAMHYFTGSKEHNIAVRKIAVKKNYKLNEYGVFRGDDRIAGKTEKEVYAKMDLPYFEPELRENRGEIKAAQKGNLPELITLEDIRGDLHVHTKATDGHYSLEDMVKAAENKGYEYVAVSDHSQKVTVANGMDAKRLRKQMEKIDQLQDKSKKIKILKSMEVDILEDGSLDLADEVLKELDFTVCSVHYNLNLSRKKQTERVIKAMDNPFMNILGHPSGRLIHERKPLDLDMEKIMETAAEKKVFLEINSHPDRLDLNDIHCKWAKEMGVKTAITTDAHSIDDLDLMRFGVGQARRGWLEPGDIINTLSWKKLKKHFKRH
ncbi:MAG: DNA polymerase/3'-5' exonuclease PolX [Candidatus Aminicenantes bacterium]|nr:DNA polymerase/3'-5' exonuclease PolX [Candidatus Aminicenantes bacterium]